MAALTVAFFNRPTLVVARALIGKYLVRRLQGKAVAFLITETEAYDGFKDKASHAHRGETPRNSPMFGSAGYWYVYFTYGIHYMLNAVTGGKGYPAAVLIRGIEGWNGPAKLTKALKIDKRLNKKKAVRLSGLWIEDRGKEVKRYQVIQLPRIRVDYAGDWAKKPYRFVLKRK